MTGPRSRTDAQYLDDASVADPKTGCRLWVRGKTRGGYGRACIRGLCTRAHRMAWIVHRGPIPRGMNVCHRCDTPACINVAHLFLGDDLANCRDKEAKGRANHARGERNGRAVLSVADVSAIRAMPGTHRAAADVFGVSASLVSQIRRGEIWREAC